ncbi:MAG TPA: hypothetical protein VGD50_08315 [Candidatus Baltobacteraceae bacterium]
MHLRRSPFVLRTIVCTAALVSITLYWSYLLVARLAHGAPGDADSSYAAQLCRDHGGAGSSRLQSLAAGTSEHDEDRTVFEQRCADGSASLGIFNTTTPLIFNERGSAR